MRPDRATGADQADLRVGLSQASDSSHSNVITPVGTECIEDAFDCEQTDLPMSFVPCRRCGEMAPLVAVECPACGAPHPRRLEVVRCAECGDENGPWGRHAGRLLCEPCIDRSAA